MKTHTLVATALVAISLTQGLVASPSSHTSMPPRSIALRAQHPDRHAIQAKAVYTGPKS